jgi:hypothetical protein
MTLAMARPFLARLMQTARGGADAPRAPDFSSGALFRNRPGYGPVEYAEVIDSGVDPVGIRHVRFRLFFGYRDKTVDAGERTLAQLAFTSRFNERVSRQAARNGGDALRS